MLEGLKAFVHHSVRDFSNRLPLFLPKKHGGVCQYLFTFVLMVVALMVRLAIAPVEVGLQYVTFFPAVTLAAVTGGFWPGVFATMMGLSFATVIFTPPYYSLSLDVLRFSFWSNMAFLIDGLIVSLSIEALHRYREQLRIAAIAFETNEAIMIMDAACNLIRVNRAFESLTDYRAEEVIGKNPRFIFCLDRNEEDFYANLWQTVLRAGTWSEEMWGRRKNGAVYAMKITITAIRNDNGEAAQFFSIFTDISERKKAEEEIYNLAFYDALTGLPNRRLFLDRLHLALSVSARNQQHGAVLFLDMDKFKILNDTLGHDFGDMLLVEISHRLKLCVREVDTVARFGGDEFIVLIENVSEDAEDAAQKIAHIAEKIRIALASPYRLHEHRLYSSPSIGICLYYGTNESANALIKRADMAMYQAKDAGRNKVQFFDPSMQHLMDIRSVLESDLRDAIADQQLQLYYQLQLNHDQQPIGAEALLRWMHPERGMVLPELFIPIAEESSLILEIGHWVLDAACKQIAAWSTNEQTRYLVLAINVSARQFRQRNFVEEVAAVIHKHNIEPSRLKLELTESLALDDIEIVVEKMHALRQILGVTLSLDDFGTGYSSLSCLKQLPLDQIKIPHSFVCDITTDANAAVIVKTIIDVAKNFGFNVIAEGVETEAQLDYFKNTSDIAYQGYLFSKPVPSAEFEALLN